MLKFKVDDTELLEDIDLVSKSYRECMNYLKAKLPDGREKSIAITNMETSWLWACESLMEKYRKQEGD